ncbi:hypothetical protein [Salinicoccus roseus]|uniref:hypothetical protein n=1 Tax=Salinicoccus roseus TaxID=45670 RepID=UPI00230108F3|nr:hypothetical protein [Salinicoccus roseus]
MDVHKVVHRPPDKVDVIKMIKIESLRGDGSNRNPIRRVYQYFDMSGVFIFEIDTLITINE